MLIRWRAAQLDTIIDDSIIARKFKSANLQNTEADKLKTKGEGGKKVLLAKILRQSFGLGRDKR